jgi:hypothetical protein
MNDLLKITDMNNLNEGMNGSGESRHESNQRMNDMGNKLILGKQSLNAYIYETEKRSGQESYRSCVIHLESSWTYLYWTETHTSTGRSRELLDVPQ